MVQKQNRIQNSPNTLKLDKKFSFQMVLGTILYWTIWIQDTNKNIGDLKSGQVKILKGQREIGLQMVQNLNGIWNLEAQLFRNPDKNVQILNSTVFK